MLMQPGKREVNARSQTVVNFEMTRGLIRPVPEAGISIPPDADGSLGISGVVPFGDPSSSYLSLSVANKFRSIQASPETARRSGTRASCHDGAQDPQEASLDRSSRHHKLVTSASSRVLQILKIMRYWPVFVP
jgi:hypothetical protein